jgi:hypothetical protein
MLLTSSIVHLLVFWGRAQAFRPARFCGAGGPREMGRSALFGGAQSFLLRSHILREEPYFKAPKKRILWDCRYCWFRAILFQIKANFGAGNAARNPRHLINLFN